MVYNLKLSSNFQVVEFSVDDADKDFLEKVQVAVDLINSIGGRVQADISKPKEEMATEKQINFLSKFGIDAKLMTKKQASAKIKELTSE